MTHHDDTVDRLVSALEPLWRRAETPDAEAVPDSGTVTVFMKDCREALALVRTLRGSDLEITQQDEFEAGVRLSPEDRADAIPTRSPLGE